MDCVFMPKQKTSGFHSEYNVCIEIFFVVVELIFSFTGPGKYPLWLLFPVSLVSYQHLFHAAVFKYIFISTKVEFIVFTFTLYSKKQAETKVMNKRLILTFLLFIYLFNIYLLTISTILTLLTIIT